MNIIFHQSKTVINKFNFLWNQLDAIVFVFFTRMTQNQSSEVWKHRGNIIKITRNTDVNIGDLKIFFFKCQKRLIFQMLSSISPICYFVCFNLILDCRAMTLMVYLAPWYESHSQGSGKYFSSVCLAVCQKSNSLDSKYPRYPCFWTPGHSLSVQCYEFCLHVILFL